MQNLCLKIWVRRILKVLSLLWTLLLESTCLCDLKLRWHTGLLKLLETFLSTWTSEAPVKWRSKYCYANSSTFNVVCFFWLHHTDHALLRESWRKNRYKFNCENQRPWWRKLQTGDKNVRARKTPETNPDATTLKQLITEQAAYYWTNSHEPVLTYDITTGEVKQIIFRPMCVLMGSQLN